MDPKGKYKPFPVIRLDDRQWPNHELTQAPIWCSVDLRDGNQALAVPMTVSQKLEMFDMLVSCGFKEIEIGFPSASPTEFEFTRRLIEEGRIPSDVTIQVLVQAREDLIKRTVESLVGAKRVIIHLYNSTSPAQRRVVFGLEKRAIVEMATMGTCWVWEHSAKLTKAGTKVRFEYSPESFSATEVEFALEVCEAVMDEWCPTQENKIILNLPDTVQVAMPNVYADQIEWFCRHVNGRDCAIISIHTHNDRGTGVAATELGMLAGADRVEGTLFGNGERTGNLDIVTVALNMFSQGIDPKLDFSNIESVREGYERTTGMMVPQRQPYSGELVFTAFSGSHQDAIKKGLQERAKVASGNSEGSRAKSGAIQVWDVPYLSIDPKDIGRKYEEVIRVNGQSGKGGIAYLLEQECGIHLPKEMLREFGSIAGKAIDALGREVTSADLKQMLWKEYVERKDVYVLKDFRSVNYVDGCQCHAVVKFGAEKLDLIGNGNGPIDAFIQSWHKCGRVDVSVLDQSEHTLGEGSDARAIAYIQLQFPDGVIRWGVGVDTSIQLASIRAVVSALNRE